MNSSPHTQRFTVLPHPIHLSYLTLLSLEDILAVSTTSHEMRQLCADNVVWQAIYKDLVDRCFWQLCESRSYIRSLDNQRRPTYKHKTLNLLLSYFDMKIDLAHAEYSHMYSRQGDYINFDNDYASDEDWEYDPEWNETIEKWELKIDTLAEHERAIHEALKYFKCG